VRAWADALRNAAPVNVLLLRNSLQLRPRPELSPTELLSLVASKLLDLGAEQARPARSARTCAPRSS
jgi:hypothetical protein